MTAPDLDEWVPPWSAPQELVPAPADPEPEQLVEPLDEGGRLFGAVAVAPTGGFRPTATVTLGGVLMDGTAGVLVVDGLSVIWGRERATEQTAGPAATLTLLDLTGTWVPGRRLVGLTVVIGWTEPSYTPPAGQGAPVIYRGRVTRAVVRRHRYRGADGAELVGLLVELTTTGIQQDLANRSVASAPWPQETMLARRDRIVSYVADVCHPLGGSPVNLRAYWQPAPAAAVDVDNKPAMDLIRELFDGAGGDRATYNPQNDSFDFLPRRDLTGWTTLAGLNTGYGRGNNLGPLTTGVKFDGYTQFSDVGWVDANALAEPDPLWTDDQATRITRVELTYLPTPSGATAPASTTLVQLTPGLVESTDGVRAVSVSTVHADTNFAQTAAFDWSALVSREGAQPPIPPLEFDTSRTDGFLDARQAQAWLAGYERQGHIVIEGSVLPLYGIRPVFGIMGARIDYRGGYFTVTADLAPISTGATVQTALAWADTVDPTQRAAHPVSWTTTRPTRTQHALSPAMTYADTRHIGYGLGAAAGLPPG